MNALSTMRAGSAGSSAEYQLRLAEICRRLGLPPAMISPRCARQILPEPTTDRQRVDHTLHDLVWSVRGAIRGVVPCVRKTSDDRVTYRITFWSQSSCGEPVPQHVTAVLEQNAGNGQGLRLVLPEELSNPTEDRKVLVVEDDPEVAELEKLILEAAGFRVIRTGDGLDGLRLAQSQPLAAVVLDADLPGMDGFEICLRLRANPFTNSLPILFLSGNANAPLMALASGADKVLSKPEGISELVPALCELLKR
jgi:CheY-like chemotaxis protein